MNSSWSQSLYYDLLISYTLYSSNSISLTYSPTKMNTTLDTSAFLIPALNFIYESLKNRRSILKESGFSVKEVLSLIECARRAGNERVSKYLLIIL